MVRAAAKNFKNVTIITNKNDYSKLIEEIEKITVKLALGSGNSHQKLLVLLPTMTRDCELVQ